jgi:hypothetical protein
MGVKTGRLGQIKFELVIKVKMLRRLLSRPSARFRRTGALDLDAIAGSHVWPIVPDRLVMRAAIVPERDRMRAPAKAAGPFRLVAMINQESQHALAFERWQFVDLRGEVGVHVNDLLAGDGMLDDDWVHRDRRGGTEDAPAVVSGGQAQEVGLHARRERIIGRIHVGEHGVAAAVRWHCVIVENAAERRDRPARLVRMKILAGNLRRGFVVMEFPHIRVVGGLADCCPANMLPDRAEIAPEPDVVVEADLLVAEKDHLVLDECPVQLLDLVVRQRPGQVDIADFGPDVRRYWLDGN